VKYQNVLQAVYETPWAIRPSVLAAILEVVHLRASEAEFSEEEVRERVEGAPYYHSEAEDERRQAAKSLGNGAVALIPIYGVISPKATFMQQVSGGTAMSVFRQSLAAAVADESVSSIVLDVDSPGGTVDMIPEAAADIRRARKVKPVVAVANTMAASGAYWLASQADSLFISPSGQVGSIGVFTAHDDLSKAMEKAGVSTTLISAGKFKTEGNPYEPLSDEAKAHVQARVDSYYKMFTADVAVGRKVKAAAVREGFGQGRMLLAEDAVREGMADGLATLEEVISRQFAGSSNESATYFGNDGTLAGEGKSGRKQMDEDHRKLVEALGLTVEDDRVLSPEGEEMSAEDVVAYAAHEPGATEPTPEQAQEIKARKFAEDYPEEAAQLEAQGVENKRHRAEKSVQGFEESVLQPNKKALSPAARKGLEEFLVLLPDDQVTDLVGLFTQAFGEDGIVDLSERGSDNGHEVSASEALERRVEEIMEQAKKDGKAITTREALDQAMNEDPRAVSKHISTVPAVAGSDEDEEA